MLSLLNRVRITAATVTLAVVAWVSLMPRPDAGPPRGPVVFYGISPAAGAVLNVWFYLPVGAVLCALTVGFRRALAAGACLSLLMEASQLFIPGRVSSLTDLVTNTVGVAVGYAAVRSWRTVLNPSRVLRDRLGLLAGLAFAGWALTTGYLMVPEFPRGNYVAQWLPDLDQYDQPYDGSITLAEVGSYPAPRGPIEDDSVLRTALIQGGPIRIAGTAAAPPASLSPLFALVRRYRQPLVVVGVDGTDVTLSLRRRASRWGLARLTSYSYGLMEGVSPGSEFTLVLKTVGRRTCISLEQRTDCSLSPTLGRGWKLYRDPVAGSEVGTLLLSLGWLAFLTFPLGLWLPSGYRAVATLAFLLIGALGAPLVTGLAATSLWDWMAIGLGLLAGLGTRHTVHRWVSPSDRVASGMSV